MLEKAFITSISLGAVIIGGSKLLNFILKLLVSQLGVENFGDYYLAISTFIGLTTVAALGIPMSTTRFISFLNGQRNIKSIRNVISTAMIVIISSSLFMSGIVYGYADTMSALLDMPNAAVYLRILSFGFMGSSMTLLIRAVFLGYVRIRLTYVIEALEVTLKFLFTVGGLLVMQRGVLGALVGYVAGTLSASCINFFILANVSDLRKFTPRLSLGFLRFAWPVSASEILTAAANIILLYIVRIRGGGETVGFYAAAVSIASFIHMIPQMVLSIFLPVASTMFAQKKPVFPIYKTLIAWLGVVSLIPSFFIALLSPNIISMIFGSSYKPAAIILTMLAMAYGIYAMIAWPNRQLLDMAGHTKDNLVLTVLRIVISMGAILFLQEEINGTSLAGAVLYGWIGESIGSLILVKRKRLI